MMSDIVPSAPQLSYDNHALEIDDELPGDFNIYNQSIYYGTDSANMTTDPEYYNPFHHQDTNVPGSPFSEKSFLRTFSTISRHSAGSHYTRQINMSIGEEWENVHHPHGADERKAFTCPPTPKKQYFTTQPLNPWTEEPEKHQHINDRDDPLRYFFNRLSEEERVAPKDYVIQPNPHNTCNHRVHAMLHCPCFFFFCLLCCFPGVHYMQRSDEEYRTGHEDRAKVDSRLSTILYTLGIVAAVVLLSGLIYFSVSVVHGKVS